MLTEGTPQNRRRLSGALLRLAAVAVSLTALCLAGCASNNTRLAEIGQVSARAHLDKGVASYYEIDIANPLDDKAPRLWIRMPDGKIIDRAWFTFSNLQKAGFVNDVEHEYQLGSSYSQMLTAFGASFFFNYGTLIKIRVTHTPNTPLGIALEHGKFFTLPMSEKDLEQLFGKPIKTSDAFRL